MTATCTGGPGGVPRPQPLHRWRRLVLAAAAAAWRMLARQRALAGAPQLPGFPARHPESLRKRLPGRHERWLTGLGRQLWPGGEYADITRAYRDLPGTSRGGTP